MAVRDGAEPLWVRNFCLEQKLTPRAHEVAHTRSMRSIPLINKF